MFDTQPSVRPGRSRVRDAGLLRAAEAAGPGDRAGRLLGRIDTSALCSADRVRYLAALGRQRAGAAE